MIRILRSPHTRVLAVLFGLLAIFSCRHRKDGAYQVIDPDATAPPTTAPDEAGLVIRLSHADPDAADRPRPKLAEASELSAADTKKVLARLPAFEEDPDARKAFALRESSKPPPLTGATVLGAFAPKPTRAKKVKPKGALQVVRFAPEGDVAIAPHVSITFSHPMVPVTSLDTLAASKVPVTLHPMPPAGTGKWRWIGTKTLQFEPDPRMPMATSYRVTIPAGTKSAVGTALAQAHTFTFATPPPKVETFHPQNQPVRLQPLMFAGFDQRIDRAKVAETIKLKIGRQEHAVRLATPQEIEADPIVRNLAAQFEDDRWLAIVPKAPLSPDARVVVKIGPGTPSAEGPRTTTTAQTFEMRTFGPMKVTDHRCGWDGNCPPGTPFQIELSNPIDTAKFDASMVTVAPPLPAMDVQVWGQTIMVSGRGKARTAYKVTLSANVPDAFGQRLGKDDKLRFRVTDPDPSLFAPGTGLVVLDPNASGRFSVYSVGHAKLRVRAWTVQPQDWDAYLAAAMATQQDPKAFEPPGRSAIDRVVTPEGEADAIIETAIDLSAALTKGRGHVIVSVEPTKRPLKPWQQQRVVAWVQATSIGLQAHVDDKDMLVWATRLSDGQPLAGTKITLPPTAVAGQTDKDGLVTLPLASNPGQMIVAKHGDDVAILPEQTWWWGGEGTWKKLDRLAQLRWYVFDDRHLYRPGEEVRLKGWLRRIDLSKGGDVQGLAGSVRKVDFVLRDSQGNEVKKGTLSLNAFGAFDTKLALPKTMNLGSASLELIAATTGKIESDRHWHAFEVQEFRRPEYEVEASLSEGPHVVGTHATATVSASYYAGGALPNAEVNWWVTSALGSYRPPGHDDFVFGRHLPWWMFWRHFGGPPDPADAPKSQTFSASTDASGEHHLRMDFVSVEPALPMSVTAQATVMDVNRQAWTSTTSTIVHPGTRYVGLRSDRAFVQAGEDIVLDAIAVDIDGKPVPGTEIRITAVRLAWVQEKGAMVEKELDRRTCTKKSGSDPVRCTLAAKEGGSHRIVAIVRDEEGRDSRTELTMWVAGGELPAPRDVAQEQVLLIPDRETYEPGQTATIAVAAPWSPAEGLVTLRRSGVVDTQRITLRGPSTTIEVPITDAMTPMLTVQVDLVGAAPRRDENGKIDPKLPKRPAFATGHATLSIPARQRTLAVDVEPAVAKIEPGGNTSIDVTVRDHAGKAVANAEVALVVVDEAVLALTGYALPDPLAIFYGWRDAGVRDHHLRAHVTLARPGDTASGGDRDGDAIADTATGTATSGVEQSFRLEGSTRARRGGKQAAEAPPPPPAPEREFAGIPGKDGRQSAPQPIAMRTDFSALALFSPSVITDAAGKARVPVKVPDSLTRYRIMAVAVAGDRQFGTGESTITARLPLMVRPSFPRFLNFGDELELPIVLQNQTEEPMTVDLALRTSNLELVGGAGRRVQVPAGDRVEVRVPARAAEAGTARAQIGAVAGTFADAATVELPVWTPATTEAFATYGEIDKGAIAQPVVPPKDVFEQFGGLEITTSSTALQALTDAVLYLVAYPFDCSEQIASRVLAIASLRDVLTAFQAEGLPNKKALEAAVAHDVQRLKTMQTPDGGFSFRGSGWPSWPYLTIHVAHALERAKLAGFAVPAPMLTRVQKYLEEIEKHLDPKLSIECRRIMRAYALYVRQVGGAPDVRKATALFDEAGIDKLPLEALAWLLPTFAGDKGSAAIVAKIHRHFGNRVSETAAAAHFVTSYEDAEYVLLHSDRRADALILEGLIASDPKNDLVPKLVRGLLDHRKAGRWSSTQENAFVLVALDKYFDVYEKATPDFVARAWLGDQYAGDHAFRGRTTERHHVDVPMQWLTDRGKSDLVIAKEGKGRLYYRVGMRYAPRDLKLPPYDAGFVVQRTYEAIDDPKDVQRDKDGTWRIAAGARVRVRLKMVAEGRRYHVALVDPLPAGLEPLNPVLATTGALPSDPQDQGSSGGFWWWWRPWYEHQNMRDERVEAFASLVWAGVHDFDYIARATTPGRFVVPPSKAEEMYHPETFGRGAGDIVVVQ